MRKLMFGSEISEYCRNILLLKDYSITPDGVNVNGDVWLYGRGLTDLPFKFNKVDGNFYCHHNNITTLVGAPNIITGDFLCSNNYLTSLEFCPNEVGGDFYAYENEISTLFFAPKKVGGDFMVYENCLPSLYSRFDINIGGQVSFDWERLPDEFQNISEDKFNIVLKYQRLFEVWNHEYGFNSSAFNPSAFKLLIEEIDDGLL